MTDKTEDVAETAEEMRERLAKAKLQMASSGVTRSARERRKVEHKQRKSVGDLRALRSTGRTALFAFRCREGLHAECMAAAGAEGVKLAEWMETVLEAALDASKANRGEGS